MTVTVQKSIPPRAWLEILLMACIWGGSFLSNRVALNEVGVFTTVAFRVGGAALVLWAYVLLRGLPLPKSPKIWLAFLGMGLLNNAIPFSLIVWGQQHIESGLASILNASTAIFGILVAAIVFADERLTPRKAVGVTLGFFGVATVIGLNALTHLDLTSLAQIAILLSSLTYGLAAAFARLTLKGVAPQVAAAGMLTGGALIMVPTALITEGLPTMAYSWSATAALLYLAVIASAFAFLMYYRILAIAGAGNVSLVTLLVAPIAVILGAVVLGEALNPNAYAGFALLALGLLVIDGRILRLIRH